MNITANHVIVIAVIVVILLAIVAGVIGERRRRRELTDTFARLGGAIDLAPAPDRADDAWRYVGLFRSLKTGARGVRWCARVCIEGLTLHVFEHRYTTGSGKSQTTHHHTIVSLPCSADWPVLALDHEHLFHKIADLFGKKDLQLDDPAFNARWRVRADDENFAIVFLSPEVQARLMALPRGTRLRVGQGAVCLAYARRIQPREVEHLLRQVVDLWHALPPELRHAHTGT
jgi:hypothetical protein